MRRTGMQIKEEDKEVAGNLYLCDGGIKKEKLIPFRQKGGLGMVTRPNLLSKNL